MSLYWTMGRIQSLSLSLSLPPALSHSSVPPTFPVIAPSLPITPSLRIVSGLSHCSLSPPVSDLQQPGTMQACLPRYGTNSYPEPYPIPLSAWLPCAECENICILLWSESERGVASHWCCLGFPTCGRYTLPWYLNCTVWEVGATGLCVLAEFLGVWVCV